MGFLDELNAATAGLNKFSAGARASASGTKSLASELLTLGTALKVGLFEGAKALAVSKWKEYWVGSAQELKRQELALIAQRNRNAGLRDEMISLGILYSTESQRYKEAEAAYAQAQEEYALSVQRLEVSKSLHTFVKEQAVGIKLGAAAAGLLAAAWGKTVRMAETYNAALIQANSAFNERYRLVGQLLTAQTALGAETGAMAEAAGALTDYGLELETSFSSNVQLVTMLREGLGVAASAGADLVVSFERGLKQSAKDVADVIARIAASTGLSAQKAAQYTAELARSLRLLGPLRTEAAGVSKAVLDYASRVEELGGNSAAVVSLFKQMTGGTAQAFMLRGLAGVSPAQLTTAEGVERAMAGLGRSMQRMVNAAPGTEAYVAQLQVAAEIHGVAAEDVRNYLDAVARTKRPLNEAVQLQNVYREQTQTVGKAWQQIAVSLHTLYMRVMTPVLGALAPMLRGFADIVNQIVSSRVGVAGAAVVLAGALTAAAVAMTKLTVAALSFKGLAGTGLGNWMALVKGGSGALFSAKSLGSLAGLGAGATWGAGILGAFAGGYGLGTVLERYLPEKMEWWHLLSPLLLLKPLALLAGKWYAHWVDHAKGGTYRDLARVATAPDYVRATAQGLVQALMRGQGDYDRIFLEYAAKNPHIKTAKGAQAFQESVMELLEPLFKEQVRLERFRTETTAPLPADELRRQALRESWARAQQVITDKKTQEAMQQMVEMQKAGLLETQEARESLLLLRQGDRNQLFLRDFSLPFGAR